MELFYRWDTLRMLWLIRRTGASGLDKGRLVHTTQFSYTEAVDLCESLPSGPVLHHSACFPLLT